MIKVEKLNKYYNYNRRNELHVLNDVDLTFDKKGLVVLLGESGSGKTTLLNVLGGMDSFHKGAIMFDDLNIKKYRASLWDETRLQDIGIIFQNYYLLPTETVYENIALTLRMQGVIDEEEISNRIDYLLSAVNMGNYAKRKASQLSGGQQQRIAIARALAKNPKVILADEPTGNLDSKNTIDIMNIIKQISKDKLVILVTHEQNLADYYADRIITVEDGKISKDIENSSTGKLDYSHETDIYLQDLSHTQTKNDDASIEIYRDDVEEPMSIKLILKNNTLYLDMDSPKIKKLVNVKDRPDIKFYDKSIRDDVVEDIKPFDYESVINQDIKHHHGKNPVALKQVLSQTWDKLIDAKRGQKFLYLAFLLGAMVLAFAVSNIFSIITVDDSDFLTYPKNTVAVEVDDYDAFLTIINTHDSISGFTLTELTNYVINYPKIFGGGQGYYRDDVPVIVAPIDSITQRDIRHGRLPENDFEIVVTTTWVEQNIIMQNPFYALGYTETKDALNFRFDINISGQDLTFDIVGIIASDVPTLYAKPMLDYQFRNNEVHPHTLVESITSIEAGRMIENESEILMPIAPDYEGPFEPYEHTIAAGVTKTVVGLYSFETELTPSVPIVHDDYMLRLYFQTTSQQSERYLYSTNVEETLRQLEADGFEASHIYSDARSQNYQQQLANSMPSLIFSGLIIGATALSFFFMIRASMIHRIYEIGVYRSLGTKKRHIIKRFAVESAIITTFSSVVGFSIMTYILYSTQRTLGSVVELFHVSLLSITAGVVIIYVVNIISGLIPVFFLLRKTPAQINTQYDL